MASAGPPAWILWFVSQQRKLSWIDSNTTISSFGMPDLCWKASTAVVGAPWLIRQMALDGFYYYAYNEVAFITLNQVAPVTHSIANTIKRVCIILATVLVFGNKMTGLGAAGSAIAIFGTFVYSIAKSKYK